TLSVVSFCSHPMPGAQTRASKRNGGTIQRQRILFWISDSSAEPFDGQANPIFQGHLLCQSAEFFLICIEEIGSHGILRCLGYQPEKYLYIVQRKLFQQGCRSIRTGRKTFPGHW